jgi:phosphoribosylformylglycinamidine synthase I
MKPKALVLQAHGSNRDFDVMDALNLAGADAVGVPLNDLYREKAHWRHFQMLVLPGGFSYGDALGAGKLLAIDMTSYFADEITAFVDSGKPVIGICNGFQALVKSGILPGNDVVARRALSPTKQSPTKKDSSQQKVATLPKERVARNDMAATLTFNAEGHFECRWVNIKPVSETCVWTRDLDEDITCPIAHGEGNFQVNDPSLVSGFQQRDQIALTYTHTNGSTANGEYPFNPNGSLLDIAGICNPAGNVLGLMPHPENHIHTWQHPRHTRGENNGNGLKLFENGVAHAMQV